jgi:hypothetical protein
MSPVFQTAICGPFREANDRQMVFHDAGVLALLGLAQGKQCQVHSLHVLDLKQQSPLGSM